MSVATDSIKMAEVKQPPSAIQFVHVAPAHDGAKHAIGIDADGTAYSWGSNNAMGQLGRSRGELSKPYPVLIVPQDADIRFSRGFAGGLSESGHSAILDTTRTRLYIAGCDRWQQLGLGSSSGGASGYTWTDGGRIWRNEFVFTKHLHEFMNETSGTNKIRDVALGGDHTVVLSGNQHDVYTFGKGGEGQLGVMGKPFVSAPVKSTKLSSKSLSIAAVCAIQHCSLTIDDRGNVMDEAGKCRRTKDMMESLQTCINRAEKDGLLHRAAQSDA
mmetsp:Transcript_7757/g.14126  ORF Transcript_7757/g.14126 Transcript_7757/m.14126 type:complete len:272 (-) Transcript_7757:75-890(-)